MQNADIPGLNDYLKNCREITQFCSQNGWINNASLEIDIIEHSKNEALIAVYFDEIIMEGAGCVAGTIPCYGRIRVKLNSEGNFESLKVV